MCRVVSASYFHRASTTLSGLTTETGRLMSDGRWADAAQSVDATNDQATAMLTWLLQNPPQPCYEYGYGLHVDAMRAQTEAFPAYRDAVSKFAAGELDQASAALTIARPLIDDANN